MKFYSLGGFFFVTLSINCSFFFSRRRIRLVRDQQVAKDRDHHQVHRDVAQENHDVHQETGPKGREAGSTALSKNVQGSSLS